MAVSQPSVSLIDGWQRHSASLVESPRPATRYDGRSQRRAGRVPSVRAQRVRHGSRRTLRPHAGRSAQGRCGRVMSARRHRTSVNARSAEADRRRLCRYGRLQPLIGLDDVGTLERLRALRRNLIDPAIEEHGGRIVQTGGNSLLIVFDSIDGAVRCAVKVQQQVPSTMAMHPLIEPSAFASGSTSATRLPTGLICTATP